MRKGLKIFAFVVFVLAMISPALSSVQAASSTQTSFSASILIEGNPTDGSVWITGQPGILHGRDLVATGTVSGDINGAIVMIENLNLFDYENGPTNGQMQLIAEITVASESQVSYLMSGAAKIRDRIISGTFVIRGIGTFKRQIIVGKLYGELADGQPVPLIGTRISY